MSSSIRFILNDSVISSSKHPATVLLDFIRKEKNLTGTKEACREGDCGACTVLVGKLVNGSVIYRSVNSCLYPIANCEAQHVVTIEGLNNSKLSLIQEEFVSALATQCGFCTPGFIVSLTGYLLNNKTYSVENAINAIAGNICRCTGYGSIKRALKSLFKKIKLSANKDHINQLIENKILPEYFESIRLQLVLLRDKFQRVMEDYDSSKIIIAGGTDLYVQQGEKLDSVSPHFITNEMSKRIFINDGKLCFTGSVSFEDVANSNLILSRFPALVNNVNLIASLPIRNSASIAGNIINASPIGDFTIIFLALDAQLKLTFHNNERFIQLKDFYKGYKKLEKDKEEVLDEIRVQLPTDEYKFSFEKVSKRTYLDIATVNSAMLLKHKNGFVDDLHISLGGVAPIPLYLHKSREQFTGKRISNSTIKDLIDVMLTEISPISDVRGSEEYKKLLAQQLIKAHFIKLCPELVKSGDLVK